MALLIGSIPLFFVEKFYQPFEIEFILNYIKKFSDIRTVNKLCYQYETIKQLCAEKYSLFGVKILQNVKFMKENMVV
jgi:hypothetical protein